MEADSEEDELLNLSLSVNRERKKKGKIIISRENNNMMSTNRNSYEGYEGKIFHLLQMREQMLRKSTLNIEDSNGLPLIHLLLTTATSVDENNLDSSLENLTDLYQTVSLTGDSVQRVVAYFTDGLTAKLLTKKSPFYEMLMEEPTIDEEFLAFTDLYRVSPYFQFAHFTANQAILEAFEKEEEKNNRSIHVIDFDASYGFQWPSLIQSLSEKATSGNRISFRLTGFGKNLKELQETESRLVSFSKGFGNIVFEFQGLLRGSRVINLRKKKNETVAVNLVSYLNKMSCLLKITDTLGFVHSLNPSIVVIVEQEGSKNPSRTFLSRFTDTLHYFAAMFDSLDDCLPLESIERLRIEKKVFGKEIKSMLNNYDDVEGGVDCAKYEKMETWKSRMENNGFVGMKMSSKCLIQAKLLLKMRTHYCPLQFEEEGGGGFRVSERDDGRAISLGWQNRFLLTVSAWQSL
ncbi:putative transcription factor GRAS family [Medicago truncatula]|uniref:GRAS family transcription factor n=1 Tax=Medicago truncatula TaxID=3880 RepID=G7IAF8_MEDTR|nr:GRAS family protein RAM1 [Medicago truncatula]AES62244.1 GRAS family transcription factor [Medicago truncatula]AZZ09403.1 PINNATE PENTAFOLIATA2 [Medicago truncatula]RHN81551.1 putative transcription factor GRAS family [Medicago truncatula]UYF10690.1 GRAS transcription factor pinnate-like pentafoliata2 [Medicago truncatula]